MPKTETDFALPGLKEGHLLILSKRSKGQTEQEIVRVSRVGAGGYAAPRGDRMIYFETVPIEGLFPLQHKSSEKFLAQRLLSHVEIGSKPHREDFGLFDLRIRMDPEDNSARMRLASLVMPDMDHIPRPSADGLVSLRVQGLDKYMRIAEHFKIVSAKWGTEECLPRLQRLHASARREQAKRTEREAQEAQEREAEAARDPGVIERRALRDMGHALLSEEGDPTMAIMTLAKAWRPEATMEEIDAMAVRMLERVRDALSTFLSSDEAPQPDAPAPTGGAQPPSL